MAASSNQFSGPSVRDYRQEVENEIFLISNASKWPIIWIQDNTILIVEAKYQQPVRIQYTVQKMDVWENKIKREVR